MTATTLEAPPREFPMSLRSTLATANRVMRQLLNDHRTIALIMLAPCLLIILFKYVFEEAPLTFDRVGMIMLGLFPLVVMFLVTSIAMVRERTSGTLERLLTTPLHKLDLLLGYATAFGVLALVQSVLVSIVTLGFLDLDVRAGAGVVVTIAVLNALLGTAMGLFMSAFARTEFQAVQFLPAFLLPQVLLCGLLTPRDSMAPWLQYASDVMPLSYAVDALIEARDSDTVTGTLMADVLIVAALAIVGLALGAATLRRRSP